MGVTDDRTGGAETANEAERPYGVELPEGWTRMIEEGRVTYENPAEDLRITVEEFSKLLSLYWWVDVHERRRGTWVNREAGVGESYTDPSAVARDVQALVARRDRPTGNRGQ